MKRHCVLILANWQIPTIIRNKPDAPISPSDLLKHNFFHLDQPLYRSKQLSTLINIHTSVERHFGCENHCPRKCEVTANWAGKHRRRPYWKLTDDIGKNRFSFILQSCKVEIKVKRFDVILTCRCLYFRTCQLFLFLTNWGRYPRILIRLLTLPTNH